MGFMVSSIWNKFFFSKDYKIVIHGLESSGKTSLLYYLIFGEKMHMVPSIGFNLHSVNYNNLQLTFWELGGGNKIKKLYEYYYKETQGLIYVIDSVDTEKYDEAKRNLKEILDNPLLNNVPLLILATKQDLNNAKTELEIKERIDLDNCIKDRNWSIFPTSIYNGNTINEGLNWLTNELINNN